MCMEKSLWEIAVDFHGHECFGLALGYRVAESALQSLGKDRSEDEELVAVVENDSCAVDAIQALTGCTFGKGNLIFNDYGKQVFTFILRNDKKTVRIAVKSSIRERVAKSMAAAKDRGVSKSEVISELLSMPLEDICEVREVECLLPEKARIYPSVACNRCGEMVMEPRARMVKGSTVCIPCFQES